MNTQPLALQVPHESPVAERIGHLDGLRGIAILAVVGYHYYARFADHAQLFYPYGNVWSGFILFEYGYYGVHLFFAISGFVIALSLERCRSSLKSRT
jgi:peptidoglycan/LPS O-acetylase OafA/YrhL